MDAVPCLNDTDRTTCDPRGGDDLRARVVVLLTGAANPGLTVPALSRYIAGQVLDAL